MFKLAKRPLRQFLILIALSAPALSQQEVDPSYFAPVPETAAQQPNSPVAQSVPAPKPDTKPALVSTAYHPNASRAKVHKTAAVTGRKNSPRK